MPAIILQTPEAELICFLLVAGSEALVEGASERDCLLTGPPKDPSLLEHPLSILRTEFHHVEHRAILRRTPEEVELEIPIREAALLRVHLKSGDPGGWTLERGELVVRGIAVAGTRKS